jgi:hypothetical protein
MTDLFDAKIHSAGRVPADDARVREALDALVADRSGRRSSHRRFVIPAVTITAAFGLLGTGAVAASQWGPWTYVEYADIVVARDWVDVDGFSLGSCESRLATQDLTDEEHLVARDYLATIDPDGLDPDAEYVANVMVAVGRPDDYGRLITGHTIDEFDTGHTGSLWTQPWLSDARIMQDGLMQTVFTELADEIGARWPDVGDVLTAHVETKCSTDPIDMGTP